MYLLILSFFVSFGITGFIIKYKHIHLPYSADNDFGGPQKNHKLAVPRIGGLSIFITLLACIIPLQIISPASNLFYIQLLACGFPVFLIGLLEDITKKIGIRLRLITTLISGLMFGYAFNAWIMKVDFYPIDILLTISSISIIFTAITVSGLSNAYNIIDGFNGLASMVGVITLLAISYISYKTSDTTLIIISFVIIGAILGFFVWNYPNGQIFLGDGGAYLIGYLNATLTILLAYRNPIVSPWFCLLVNGYPIFETLFTIWRRRVHQGKNPGLPDGAHFHSLIYRRVLQLVEHDHKKIILLSKNSRTSPYLWLLSSVAIFPAILFWNNTSILQTFCIMFILTYTWIYRAIVKFKTPSWIK